MLIICPTPIGNLDDVTPRQLDALRRADVIACEDTRATGKLLELLGIARQEGKPALLSYHDHNARDRVGQLIEAMQQGQRVVLVSDAGTPTISDPGFRLVREATLAGLTVSALPGPVAAIVALSAAGLPTDRFIFEGFLSARQSARVQRLEALHALGLTAVLYESPHRLIATLEDVVTVFGAEHAVCIGRELTKLHEEYVRGAASEVLATLQARDRVRGELVLILAPAELRERQWLSGEALDTRIRELLAQQLRTRDVRDALISQVELSSSELYEHIERVRRG